MSRRFCCPACRNSWATKRDAGLCCATNVKAAIVADMTAKKRGYSREFTPKTERRVRLEIDRIPPTLYEAVKAKAKREGVSLRALTLRLWRDWVCEA